jgi:hypothetical protein
MASAEEVIAVVTPASLVIDGIRRTRELYQYITPDMLSEHPAASRSRPDTPYDAPNLSPSLIPFVQLVALRCDASKAILNVIDRDTMHFLAQVSKRSIDGPKDMPMFETSEDSVLMGCSKVPVSGRVCELSKIFLDKLYISFDMVPSGWRLSQDNSTQATREQPQNRIFVSSKSSKRGIG